MHIAVQMATGQDRRRGCALLAQAAELDSHNAQIPTLLRNFTCVPRAIAGAMTIAVSMPGARP